MLKRMSILFVKQISKQCVIENLNLGDISQVLGLGFWSGSSTLYRLSWILDRESQVLVPVPWSWFLDPRSWV